MAITTALFLLAAALPAADAFLAPSILPQPRHAGLFSAATSSMRAPLSSLSMQQQEAGFSRRELLGGALAAGILSPLPALAKDAVGSSNRPVVVVGANGKTGKLCAISLVAKGGYGVRACVRGQFKSWGETEVAMDDVDVIEGVDVTKYETLVPALKDAGAVIFASSASSKGGNAEKVDCIGVENVAKACIENGVERLVVISSLAVTRPDSLGYKFTNVLGNIMDYKEQGEEKVRALYKSAAPSLSYTIVRPGGLKDSKATEYDLRDAVLTQGDVVAGEISRGLTAEVAVASIFMDSAKGATIECFDKKSKLSLLGKGLDESGVSGKHTTDDAYSYGNVIGGQKAALSLFSGLKKDSEYDPTNGYKPKKKV